MANIFANINSSYREVGNVYVNIGGTWREVESVYVNVGGVWREVDMNELFYFGSLPPLTSGNSTAVRVGDYALFTSGDTANCFNSSLVKSSLSGLSSRYTNTFTTVNNEGYIGGGTLSSSSTIYSKDVEKFNPSLVRTLNYLSGNRKDGSATGAGSYTLFAGGNTAFYNNVITDSVDAFDSSFVRTTATVLSRARYSAGGASVGGYAIFVGGYNTSPVGNVDAYSSSLVRTNPSSLPNWTYGIAGASISNYAIFGGGSNTGTNRYNHVYAYSSTLARTTPTPLSSSYFMYSTEIADKALFYNYDYYGVAEKIDVYDNSLVRTSYDFFSEPSVGHPVGVGNYVLFGNSSSNIEVLKYGKQ